MVVAELSHLLSAEIALSGFVSFVGLFRLVRYTWLGFSYYADEFDTDDLLHWIVHGQVISEYVRRGLYLITNH